MTTACSQYPWAYWKIYLILSLTLLCHWCFFGCFFIVCVCYRQPGKLQKFVADLHSGKLHREFHHGPDPEEQTVRIPQCREIQPSTGQNSRENCPIHVLFQDMHFKWLKLEFFFPPPPPKRCWSLLFSSDQHCTCWGEERGNPITSCGDMSETSYEQQNFQLFCPRL